MGKPTRSQMRDTAAHSPAIAPSPGPAAGGAPAPMDPTPSAGAVRSPSSAARPSSSVLARIIESSDDPIISCTPDGIILTCNSAAQRLLGWRSDELIGRHVSMITPGDCQETEASVIARIRTGERVDRYEARRRQKGATEIPVEVTTSPVLDPDGKLIAVSMVLRDISQRKSAEQEAQRARARAEQADCAKDRFLAMLSHELRTPLAPVVMTVASLETREELPPDVRQDLAMIRRNIELETRLIDDLLDVTRIANGKLPLRPRSISIHSIVDTVLDICRTDVVAKRIQVNRKLLASDECVSADPARLQQVLWNIIKNAVKFTRSGGAVSVSSSNPKPGFLLVEVVDNGVGIEPELLPHLFEPFQQGRNRARQFGGLGLGLAICKAVVELHGGAIRAQSDGIGCGARFSIELPTVPAAVPGTRDDAQRPHAGDGDHVLAGHKRPPVRVLLVEDHADTLRTMRRLLVGMGYRVFAAESAAEALALSAAETFDVIISDIGLPDASGNELMRSLRQRHPRKPGIALSGYGMDDDIRASADAGFAMHLTKPIDMRTLHAAILSLVDQGR